MTGESSTTAISPIRQTFLNRVRKKRQRGPQLFISMFDGKKDILPLKVKTDWAYVKTLLQRPLPRDEKDGPAWMFGTFRQNGSRHNVDVECLYGLVGDVDYYSSFNRRFGFGNFDLLPNDFKEGLNGYSYTIHTTYSHITGKPRFRVVIPFARPVTPEEYPFIWQHWNVQLGTVFDENSRDVSRMFYLPSCPPEHQDMFAYMEGEGQPFDPDAVPLLTDKSHDVSEGLPLEKLMRNERRKTEIQRRLAELNRKEDDFEKLQERVREALSFIDATEREMWLRVGMAIHYAGLPQTVWDEWAKTCPEKYDEKDQAYTWRRFNAEHHKPTTLGTVFHWAKEAGWVEAETGPEIIVKKSPMDWAELSSQKAPDMHFLISQWLGSHPTLLAGRGGVGKTLLGQILGTTLAMGIDYLDRIAEPVPVLMWCCEDDHDELWRRQERICAHFNIDMADLNNEFYLEPRRGKDNELFGPSNNKLFGLCGPYRTLEEKIHDWQIRVVILDNTAQMFGGNENDRHHVTRFINSIVGLAGGKDVAFIFLSHPSKANDSEWAGSTAWENAVRMRWYFGWTLPDEKPGSGEVSANDDIRFLCKRKTNYTEKDFRRFVLQNGVLVPDRFFADTDGTAKVREEATARRVLISAFKQLREMGVYPTDSPNSPNSLVKQIIEKGMAEDLSKQALKGMLNRLMMEGVFKRGEVDTYANRTKRYGLILVEG